MEHIWYCSKTDLLIASWISNKTFSGYIIRMTVNAETGELSQKLFNIKNLTYIGTI